MAFYLSIQTYFYSYLLVVRQQSPAAAGRIAQTFMFAAGVTAIVTFLAIRHAGKYKALLVQGAFYYLLLIYFNVKESAAPDARIADIVLNHLGAGMGAGVLMVSAQVGARAAVPRKLAVAAEAVLLLFVEVGGAVGAAVSGAVWIRLVPSKLSAYLPANVTEAHAQAIFADVVVASNYTLYPSGSPAREAINRSYYETMHILLTIAAILCAPLPLLSLFMKYYRFKPGGKGNGDGENDGENKADGVGRPEHNERRSSTGLA